MGNIKKILPIITIAAVFVGLYIVSLSISKDVVREFLTSYGPVGPLVFILLMLATYIFSPITASPLLFAGFYAFGEQVVWFVSVAVAIAAVTNFWIARIWGRRLVSKFVGQESIDKIDQFAKNYGLVTLFFLRVFLGGLNDFISYGAGLTRMRFLPYFVVSVAAGIPGTLLWYSIARKIESPVNFTLMSLLMAFVFSAVFMLGTFVFRKTRRIK